MKKPHIIVIYSDQLRRSALSCYGDPNVTTPHMDRLAAEGVRFANAYSVYPVCVPARFSLLTGQYPHTRLIPNIEWRMSPCEPTIAHEMNDNGYETCYIGKWHLYGGYARSDKGLQKRIATTYIPPKYRGGFTNWRGFDLRNNHFDTYYQRDNDPLMKPINGYQTDGLFDVAMSFLREERNPDKPVFMVLSVEAPHPPFQAPEAFTQKYEQKELILPPNMEVAEADKDTLLQKYKTYYAMIENLDHNVGRLMDFLDQNGLKDDTVLVITADHGELMGSHGLKGKSSPYEESSGVPLIISGKGVPKGLVPQDPVTSLDLFPTFEALAGLSPAENPGMNLLGNPKGNLPRQGILMEQVSRAPEGVYSPGNWRALRTARYKFTVQGPSHAAKPWQLFDMQNDPYEMNNLLNDPAHAPLAQELCEALKKMIAETEDDYEIITDEV